MNIYYPLIARTIEQLERNTAETRRAIYARARAALAAQFKDLGEELPQESQALEEAIKEIEASALGRAPDEPGTLRVVHGNKKGQGALNEIAGAPPTGFETAALSSSLEPENDGTRKPEDGGSTNPAGGQADDGPPTHPRLTAVLQAAKFHGIELHKEEFRLAAGETIPSAAALSLWAQNAGMWSRAVRFRWRHLLRFHDSGPVVLLFKDGGAGLLTAADSERRVVFVKDPLRAARFRAGRGGRIAAFGSLVGGGDSPTRRSWIRRDRHAFQPALARRVGAARAPSATRHRACIDNHERFDDLAAAVGHDGGQQGASVP